MLLFLPVILIPSITMAFYGLGGGRGSSSAAGVVAGRGLDMRLPEARFDARKKPLDKLGAYVRSEQDSVRTREVRSRDPYLSRDSGSFRASAGVKGLSSQRAETDSQAAKLLRQLDQLRTVVASGSRAAGTSGAAVPVAASGLAGAPGASLGTVSSPVSFARPAARVAGGDPDLDKLNALMDKVLRIQHPTEVPLGDTSAPVAVAVPPLVAAPVESGLGTMSGGVAEDEGFIDLDQGVAIDSVSASVLAAVVDGAQTLVSGESVSFRMAEEATLGGVRIPRGTSFTGRASLAGERLMVAVSSIRVGSRVVPVALEVVDMDGAAGIRVKGSIDRDVAKESAADAAGSLGLISSDGSLRGEALGAGAQAARSLVTRKVRLVRVGLPAGYRVLLRNRGR